LVVEIQALTALEQLFAKALPALPNLKSCPAHLMSDQEHNHGQHIQWFIA
jgi:hypothetical protein